MAPDAARVRHLLRRTLTTVRGRTPSADDDAWAVSYLTAAEAELWWRHAPVDRAHAVEVARGASGGWEGDEVEVVPAALLHDVGKVDARLGVVGRVVAALVGPVVPVRARPRLGRLGRHLDYPERGAELLAGAGSTSFVVEWARQHHRPEGEWTVDPERARVLAAADDAAG